MIQANDLPQVSPDGRFAIRVDELNDRGAMQYSTYLVDRVAQRDIAWLADAVDGGFQPDGMLRVVRPPWNAWDVLIDPVRETFRIRDDQPWLPLTAWSLGNSAYARGWSNGIEFRASDPALAAPWVETWIAIGAAALVALLAWQPWLDVVPRATLIVIGAITAIAFAWAAGTGWRVHAHMQKRNDQPGRMPRA